MANSFCYNNGCDYIVNLLILVSLYALNELYLKSLHPIFKNHFNDFLAMPLLLSYSSLVHKKSISTLTVVLLTVICSFVWEFVAPMYKSDSIGDWLDVVSYGVGSLVWVIGFRLIRRSNNEKKDNN